MAARVSSVSLGIAFSSELLRGCKSVIINSKRLIRGLRRRPVAVIYPGDDRETLIKPPEQSKKPRHDAETRWKLPETRPQSGLSGEGRSGGNLARVAVQSGNVREQLGGLRFDKALPGDKRLAKMASIARSSAFREQEGKVLLEGKRLICDAVAAGASPRVLFFSRLERLRELPLNSLGQASLVKVKFEDIKIWSDLVTPQGVIAIFSKPDQSQLTFPKDHRLQSVPLFLICDDVRDPGSLGTILRSAAAAGCDHVLLTRGCVDPWEPKVLRAAMGAHFRLPVLSGLDWDAVSEHLPPHTRVHVADGASGNASRSHTDVRTPGKDRDNAVSEESDSDESDDEPSLLRIEHRVYHENWAQRNTALVISGESRGLSPEALQLAKETDGYKLVVPTAPGVEGLNSAMMAGILLFEGRRQLMKFAQKARRAKSITR